MYAGNNPAYVHQNRGNKKSNPPFFIVKVDGHRHGKEKSRVAGRKRPFITGENLIHLVNEKGTGTMIKKADNFGYAETGNSGRNKGRQKNMEFFLPWIFPKK